MVELSWCRSASTASLSFAALMGTLRDHIQMSVAVLRLSVNVPSTTNTLSVERVQHLITGSFNPWFHKVKQTQGKAVSLAVRVRQKQPPPALQRAQSPAPLSAGRGGGRSPEGGTGRARSGFFPGQRRGLAGLGAGLGAAVATATEATAAPAAERLSGRGRRPGGPAALSVLRGLHPVAISRPLGSSAQPGRDCCGSAWGVQAPAGARLWWEHGGCLRLALSVPAAAKCGIDSCITEQWWPVCEKSGIFCCYGWGSCPKAFV